MNDEAIAIIGAACRFPGADGLAAFWRLLIDGVDAVSEIGPERWSTRLFYHPRRGEPGKGYTFAAGLIDGIDRFAPEFFGISPREAAQIDPQQRLLLELAWHALEDAGIPAARLAGSTTGVYIGASSTDYGDLRLGDPASGDAYFVAGTALSILANRLSHVFDLRGPSQVVDTACSSSLVALHQACAALRAGHIETALVGGVNLLLSPYPFIGFAQAGMLSPSGRCRAFAADSDGYVRAEGGGVVVLKPLAAALADADAIRAVIRGTAVNTSGRTAGLSQPSEAAQADLLREAYRDAGIAPDALAFIEMHGTGTPAGDPVEAAAVGAVLGTARRQPLPIGSAKSNIGHLEPASGIAGLLKAMLALEHGVLPPTLHCATPHPAIPFDRLNLRLARAPETIAPDGCAGVNSFGFGGVNAHAILAPAPARETAETGGSDSPPLLISARSEAALRALAECWRDTLAVTPRERAPLLLRAAARRRDHHPYRLALLGDPAAALGDFLAGRDTPALVSGIAAREGKLAFVYSGNGAQFAGMGEAAYRGSAGFRAAIDEADGALAPRLGWSVAARLRAGADSAALRRADIAQPLLFAIQAAVTTVLRGIGVRPAGFAGHSVGEIAAAWAAGALSLDEAARVVVARSRQQERTRGAGRMAVLAFGESDAAALLGDMARGLEIAAVNSRRSVTVAGNEAAIARLAEEAARRGIACRPLDLDFAFHSAAMEPIRDALRAELGDVSSGEPGGALISTVTGRRAAAGELDASHWWRNVRDPVRFAAALDGLVAEGCRVFAEIGPRPVLLSYMRDALSAAEADGRTVATLNRGSGEGDPFPGIATRLHVAGHDMSRAAWLGGPEDRRGLPLYPWHRERYWFARTVEAAAPLDPPLDHKLLGFREAGSELSWRHHLDVTLFPFLADHRIDGAAVMPAAAILDMALAAARLRHPDAAALELRDVELARPIVFDEVAARETRCTLRPDGEWRLASRRRLAGEAMTVHATARLGAGMSQPLLPPFAAGPETRRVSATALYRRAAALGLDYGASFRVVREVVLADNRASVALVPVPLIPGMLVEPTLLDGALQGFFALLDDGSSDAAFLPRRFGRVRAVAPFGRAPCRAELRLTRRGERFATAAIALYDAADALVAELADCSFARLDSRGAPDDFCLRTELVPAPLGDLPPPAVFSRVAAILSRLAAHDRDAARETERALLLDALLCAIAREAPPEAVVPELLAGLLRRFAGDDLPESGELWRLLLADEPDMVAELTIAATLADRLRDGSGALDPASPTLAALRRTAPPVLAARVVLAAALDEIAAQWPRDRPLRLYETGAARLGDRIERGGIKLQCVADTTPCDLVVYADVGTFDPVSAACLAPGGVMLAAMPAPNPLWEAAAGPIPEPRTALAAAGFADSGAVTVTLGPWPCEIAWARAPQAAEAMPVRGAASLAVFVEGGGAAFAAGLQAAGHRAAGDAREAGAIAFVAIGAADPVDQAGDILPRFARLATLAAERQIPFWLVTAGAQQPDGGDVVGAALWGLSRTLRNEIPGLVLRAVDLPPEDDDAARGVRLARELAAASAETEIVWTPAGRHIVRLRRGLPPAWAEPDEALVAAIDRPGRLDTLGWAAAPARAPGPGEIAVEVHAAGVNFRDVMAATGTLPEDALSDGFAGAAFGLECAGVISAVGEGVDAFAAGDRVVGLAPAALASRAVTRADAVIAIPSGLGFAAAATLPVAFLTAIYALDTLSRLAPGETVLIHTASGGAGLAAIQIAKARGATVIASAGSAEKRAFLRQVGADHVCDSRELGFIAGVRTATGGAGVDVVLNSLAGEAMEASLDLLKPFGRFVELGKRDFVEDRRFRARLLRHNVAYFAVDVDQLPLHRPELAKTLLAEVEKLLGEDRIKPLAHRCYGFAGIAGAFRLMQGAQHIGKLVLVRASDAAIAVQRRPALSLRRDGVYVVTGGVDGFGYATARWLAERGAGHLALIGRRGAATPGAAARVGELEELGAAVSIHAADVADPAALTAALAAIRAPGVPIRGVIHAAAAIVDGMAGSLSPAEAKRALAAKLGGALLLDRLTADDPLDLFWLFSSATSLVGAPGQGAYVAANAAVEALARRRRAAGGPALAIAWGPIADVGILAGRPAERMALATRLGARSMPADRALAALPALAASGEPVVALADIAWGEAGRKLPALAAPFFDDIRAAAETPADAALLDRLAELSDDGRRELLTPLVVAEAARVLRLPADAIDPRRALADLGMDSLMALELRLAIEARLRLDLPLVSLIDGASAATVAAQLAARLARPAPAEPAAALAARYESPLDAFALGGADPAAEE
ncbi:MAG TPA: SDR family NAD(P)-dependent oxidoreductase [Stellaceae bacterium]|nr:SDR family NAD(P)-dependent oxidoreductase [Stellaceae bacterium]